MNASAIEQAYRLAKDSRTVLDLGFKELSFGGCIRRYRDDRATSAIIKAAALLQSVSVDLLIEAMPDDDPHEEREQGRAG